IRMYETLPFFSGRSTLEGVYNQASLQTHFVYYLASELGATSPNPFKKRDYSRFDTEAAMAHLRLFNVSDVVALSPQLVSSLAARHDAKETARIPPYVVFHLSGPAPRYVEPLAWAPVRSSPRGWREKAWRWFTRKPLSPAHLVFTDDPRFEVAEKDELQAPPAVALPGGVEVQETVEPESLTLTTSRVGHPLLVKISFHARWRAEGADGPYLVSPALRPSLVRGRRAGAGGLPRRRGGGRSRRRRGAAPGSRAGTLASSDRSSRLPRPASGRSRPPPSPRPRASRGTGDSPVCSAAS